MFISISEFSKERNVDRDTVNAWIRKHPDVNKDCSMQGKDKIIDTDSSGFSKLDNQYPLPKPVQVINGVPENEHMAVLEDLNRKNEQIHALQQKMLEMSQQIADLRVLQIESEQVKLRLEEKTRESEEYKEMALDLRAQKVEIQGKADRLQERIDEKDQTLQKKSRKISELRQENENLEEELEELKQRSLWERIWNK